MEGVHRVVHGRVQGVVHGLGVSVFNSPLWDTIVFLSVVLKCKLEKVSSIVQDKDKGEKEKIIRKLY